MRLLLAILLILIVCSSAWGTIGDPRFAMSGWRGFAKFDEVGSCWFLNWGRSTSATYANDNYPYVRMYWRTKAGEFTDATIQSWAATAKSRYSPGVTVYWTASNEPNDRGQANQTPAEFAAGYYQYHKNLKIGDPTCKVLGPGILDWTFQSDSVWKKGKEWYEEFRQVWANDPVYSAYSMALQGNPYPPMDGFNMHTYDLRGIQGTPYEGPPTWQYLRDQALAAYADIQTYPETAGLKIWNTEYGLLRGSSLTDSADTLGGIGLWFRQQPWMERWFFFIIATSDGSWTNTVLLDVSNNINALGKAHYTLSTMGDAEVYNMPFNSGYNTGFSYIRPGSVYTLAYNEDYTLGLNFYLKNSQSYSVGDMRGRTYTTQRRIKRVTFNYRFTCDPALFQLEVDIPGQGKVWSSGSNTLDQWADIDFSAYDVNEVSFGLHCITANAYSNVPANARCQINNITLWFDNTVDVKPAQAKAMPDKRRVRLNDIVVSAIYPASFAVQAEDRSSGIICMGTTTAQVGDRCTVTGETSTSNGSRVLINPEVTSITPGEPPQPLALVGRSMGGGEAGLQGAVVDDAAAGRFAKGLSNVGLLMRITGKVDYIDPTQVFFYLDDGSQISDGSGQVGVRVDMVGLPLPSLGTDVTATGVCSTTTINNKTVRLLLPRGPSDADFGSVENYLANGGFESKTLMGWQSSGNTGAAITGSWYLSSQPHSGTSFYGHYSSYAPKSGVLYQRVKVDSIKTYDLSAWSLVIHGGNEADSTMNRLGVDPTGGNDPASTSIIWTTWDTQDLWYQGQWRQFSIPVIQPAGNYITVFLETFQQQNGWHVNCFDDVTLNPVD